MAEAAQLPARPITDAEIDTFWTDGVVCLRGVLDPALVAAMAAPVEEALRATESADLSEMGRALAAAGETIATDGAVDGSSVSTGAFVSGVDHWRSQAEFHAFAADSGLAAIVGALLRTSKVNLYEDSVLVKEPGALERTVWHQDLSYFHVDGVQLCTTWCPLDPTGPENGAVRYARGSHRWEPVFRPNLFVSSMPIPGTEGELVPDVDALAAAGECEVLTFETEPGDVVVHHARTLHAAGGNRSSTTRRRAISVRYCGDDARVRLRTGVPLKPYQHAVLDGAVLDSPDCPVVWRAP
jgi:ectoine hydroxylase-related dioxygenase (phytanoyl-CoA dioxygenase family)